MAIQVRSIDYYLKDMSYESKKSVLRGINNINAVMVQQLLEKEKDYPSLRSMGFTDNEIQEYVQSSIDSFKAVNEAMIAGERYPLFQDPEDTLASSHEFMNLLRTKTDEELIQEFGCTIEEYEPKVYKKKSDRESIEK